MKRIIAMLLTFTILSSVGLTAFAGGSALSAHSGDWLYTAANGEAEITGYRGTSKAVSVPASLNGYPVTSIGRAAFFGSPIEAVSLPSSVEEIGWWAFSDCRSLRIASFSDGLRRIDFGAFLNCPSLSSVELPSTVCEIGADAFGVSCETVTGVPDYPEERLVSKQTYTTDSSFVIRGWSGTAAEKYAQSKKLGFRAEGTLSFGDVNADGVIDTTDLILIKNNDGLNEARRRSGDLNGDGSCDASDAALLDDYLRGAVSYHELPAASFDAPGQAWLSGRTMYCDGDSIAKGSGTNSFGKDYASYCHYIGDRYGMKYVNNAVGGTTLAHVKNNPLADAESILERVLKMRGSYDVILLDGGFNDLFLKVRAGTVTEDSDRSGKYDENTTLGALEKICYFLNKNYKDSVKLFVLCHEYDDDSQLFLWESMKRALDKWDIPYVDLSTETGFTAVNSKTNDRYFFYDESERAGDRLHPLAYPQAEVYGRLIERKLNELFTQRSPLALSAERLRLAKGESDSVSVSGGNGDIKWTSSDSGVAEVSGGVVTAKAVGTSYIRAEASDGRIAAVRVEVMQDPLCVYLNRSAAELKPSEGTRLIPEFLEGTYSSTAAYSSSDESVAEVHEDGSVLAKSSGEATITCKLPNGVKTTCEVIVP